MNVFLRKNLGDIRGRLVNKTALTILSASILTSISANAAEIWQENFNASEVNGKGAISNQIDLEGVTKWSIDVSGATLSGNSDWFRVNNGKFEGRDLDGVAIWQSEVIDISSENNISLSVAVAERGKHEPADFIDIAYAVDGGEFVTITNWQGKGNSEHTLIDDFTSETVTASITSGSTLIVRISMKNNSGSEYISFDDVIVAGNTGSTKPPVNPPIEPPKSDTITNACFNCPDLTKILKAENFDDAIYYADVHSALANQANKTALRGAINGAISANHQVLTYSQVWTALTQTDQDPSNSDNVILLYKGESIAKFANGSGSQSSNPDNWNREHVWAKSHGFPSSSAAAYTDIHHLRPTDISVNSSRGNLDFDYSDNPLAEAPLNKIDGNSFEPRDAVKGDVARMTFYMDIRYEGADPQTPDLQLVDSLTSSGEPRLGKLCALLAWHEADPVDNFERTRNERIYEFQGNRNPFVDHPEWVTQVYTQACDGTTPVPPVDPVDPEPPTPPVTSSALFISEYVEGSSFNKALEIFNPTNSAVSLAGYQIKLYGNGNSNPTATASLTGTINANDVIVVGSPRIADDSPLKPLIDIASGAINFNGDDYIELTKDGQVVDSFGTKGVRSSWAANVTLVRKPAISQGDTKVNDSFNVDEQWIRHASNTFSFLGAHQFDGGETDPGPTPEPVLIGMCGNEATLINQIQGTDSASAMVGETKVIEGVVTSVVANLSGFFLQEESSDVDSDVSSSEAIFVYLNNKATAPSEGRKIRAKGEVNEFFNRTQLSLTEAVLDCGEGEAIAATEVNLPIESLDQWEALEGMKVHFGQNLQVTDTYDLAQYGQLTLSSGRLVIPTNVYLPGSTAALALADRNARNAIVLDDKNNSQYPEFIPFPSAGLHHQRPVRLGDSVQGVTGVIDYSFRTYRLLPMEMPTFTASNPRQPVPLAHADSEITVASLNVLNYFNGDGEGGGFPTSRGADSLAEFDRQSAKIVSAIAAINADVVGLMEIENDGYGELSAIAQLTNKLNQQLGANTYQYVSLDLAQLGGDAITVGMLYKPEAVSLVGNTATTSEVPFDFGNRQPLVQSFTSNQSGEVFTVAVNHFKSKGSCSSASGANRNQGDGQACWNELRVQAANKLATWLATNPTTIASDNILIIGDLNAYGQEDPIRALVASGYRNLIAEKIGTSAYSYGFGGQIGYLDHAMASNALASQIDAVSEWHINADEPRAFDYNLEKKSVTQAENYYSTDAYRAADHDPIIVSFTFEVAETLVGDFDSDGDIDINDIRQFMMQLRSGKTFSLDFDFNNDKQVNFYDVRALMSNCSRARCAVN